MMVNRQAPAWCSRCFIPYLPPKQMCQQFSHAAEVLWVTALVSSGSSIGAAAALCYCTREQMGTIGTRWLAASCRTRFLHPICRRNKSAGIFRMLRRRLVTRHSVRLQRHRHHSGESSSSCAHSMQPAGQRRCTHASLSCTRTAGPHENKPRQSKQLMHAAKASVVLNSAIASAVTPANPAAAVHAACSPLGSAAAPTHRYRVQTP